MSARANGILYDVAASHGLTVAQLLDPDGDRAVRDAAAYRLHTEAQMSLEDIGKMLHAEPFFARAMGMVVRQTKRLRAD